MVRSCPYAFIFKQLLREHTVYVCPHYRTSVEYLRAFYER